MAFAPLQAKAQDNPDYDRLRNMSREERIKAHQERIERIIRETRERQEREAAQQKERQASQQQQPQQPPQQPAQAVPGTPLPTGPVQPVAQDQQRRRDGQQPAQPTPAPAAAATSARSEARALLYFRPFDTVVNTGEVFTTEVIADSRDADVDELALRLDYPPAILNPLAVDLSPSAELMGDEVLYDTDPEEGFVALRAHFRQPSKLKRDTLATIYWEALQPTDTAEIRFGFGKSHGTALRLSGRNILGTEGGDADGVIHSNVTVRSTRVRPIAQKVGNKGLLVANSRIADPTAGIGLGLESSRTSVRAGEQFTVDVLLKNPDLLPFNRLMLYLQFDPATLEVVDTDRGNWARDRVNILDAFAHEDFPFDFHRRNDANNTTGEIVYEVARELDPIRAEGPVARVTFRALKDSPRTDIVLVHNAPGIAPTTDVQYLQQSVLENRPDAATALDGVAMQVFAAPEGGGAPILRTPSARSQTAEGGRRSSGVTRENGRTAAGGRGTTLIESTIGRSQ